MKIDLWANLYCFLGRVYSLLLSGWQDLWVGDRVNQFEKHIKESGFALNLNETLKNNKYLFSDYYVPGTKPWTFINIILSSQPHEVGIVDENSHFTGEETKATVAEEIQATAF